MDQSKPDTRHTLMDFPKRSALVSEKSGNYSEHWCIVFCFNFLFYNTSSSFKYHQYGGCATFQLAKSKQTLYLQALTIHKISCPWSTGPLTVPWMNQRKVLWTADGPAEGAAETTARMAAHEKLRRRWLSGRKVTSNAGLYGPGENAGCNEQTRQDER